MTARFSNPRAPVLYEARQNPQSQVVLSVEFRPVTQVMHTVTGTRVHADGTPISNAQPAIFDLTIGPNGEVRYVDNAKVGDLDHVAYGVTHLTWQTNEVPETLSISGTATAPVSDNEPGQ